MSMGHPHKSPIRIAVDLTPLLPGGENGGAKLMTIELLKRLSLIADGWEFILLTSDLTHDELAILDSHNVRRICIRHRGSADISSTGLFLQIRTYIKRWLNSILPLSIKIRLSYVFKRVIRHVSNGGILREVGADLLFCPFTAPLLHDPAVPTVSVVYDLQYQDYPQFFDPVDRYHRRKHFMEACRLASRIVCISDFVRETVINQGFLPSERVKTIYIQLPHRLGSCQPDRMAKLLSQLRVEKNKFILYPANYWPHKNHTLLLTAYGIYRANNPESTLKLVCTGSPGKKMENLRSAAWKMGLKDHVIYAGYLPDDELSGLMASCFAVVFPSLYEGFGMPVIEAMASGKPVLCSNVTSLPEIAGGAALLFDPRRPEQIADAIANIQNNPALASKLAALGRQRVNVLGGPEEMAAQYLQVFREAMGQPITISYMQGFYGVYPDGWTSDRMQIVYDVDPEERYLEVNLCLPAWSPINRVSATVVNQNNNTVSTNYVIRRGQTTAIRLPLSNDGGLIEFSLAPTFQPQTHGLGDDKRILACQCQDCNVVSPSGTKNLLESRTDQTWQFLPQ